MVQKRRAEHPAFVSNGLFLDQPESISKVRITITDVDGALYPAIAEVRIFSSKGILLKEGSEMTIENGALKNVSAGSTVADLKEQLYAEVGEITFLNDGSVLADADEVTNGTQIQLSVEGTIVDALNIALKEESVPEASEAAMQALRNMVDKAVAMGSDDAALNAAIANAQAVLAKEAPTVTEVVTALLDLSEAMTKAAQELWEIVTKAELEALIEAANGYLDGDYTAESLEALQAAITAAQAVAGNDDATTAEVTQAITDLSDAIAGLRAEAALNKDALAHEITLVAQMVANLDDYVASTVEGLADKLAAAQEVYANATTQEEIDAATQSLLEARLNARTKADKTALEAAIAAANALDLSSYARADAEKVSTALETAKLVLSDEAATQEEVNAAANALNEAIGALDTEGADTNAPAVGADDGQDVGSGDAATADTAAAVQTGLFAGIVIIAAAAVIIMIVVRRKHNKKA